MDLNRAMYEALVTTKDYVQRVLKKEVHPLTDTLIEAYKVYDNV